MKKNKHIYIIFILLASITVYFYFSQNSGTIRRELSDFAVEDTSSITKIFLVDNEKKSILLERKNNRKWMVNGKYEAREDAVNVLLTTIKRVAVRTPVPKPAFENVVKQIAAKHVKIEIYGDEKKPLKVYYVGHSNQEHSGTYMLIENSSVPFLTHVEGHRGFLTPRYFTNENEWRSTELFRYDYGEIASIKLEIPGNPEKSFLISESNGNLYALKPLSGNNENFTYDTAKVMHYVALFQKVHFEGIEESKTEQYRDSILSATPMHIFTVTDKTGKSRTLKTFLKPAREGAKELLDEIPIKYDLERFYGLVDEKDFVILQFWIFDPLTKTINDFK